MSTALSLRSFTASRMNVQLKERLTLLERVRIREEWQVQADREARVVLEVSSVVVEVINSLLEVGPGIKECLPREQELDPSLDIQAKHQKGMVGRQLETQLEVGKLEQDLLEDQEDHQALLEDPEDN